MVIYDLICEHGHSFEGWFRSLEDYEQQRLDSLVTCPICDTLNVSKKLATPKVSQKSNSKESVHADKRMLSAEGSPEAYGKLQAMLKKVHDYVDENYHDVGSKFTEEAISMHRGDKEKTAIRGTATAKQVKKLADEGVSALPLPERPIDKKKLN